MSRGLSAPLCLCGSILLAGCAGEPRYDERTFAQGINPRCAREKQEIARLDAFITGRIANAQTAEVAGMAAAPVALVTMGVGGAVLGLAASSLPTDTTGAREDRAFWRARADRKGCLAEPPAATFADNAEFVGY